jgi:hypothetical protein
VEYLAAIGIVALVLLVPAFMPKRKHKKNRAIAGVLSGFDEIFHPSAKQAQEIIAEQAQASKPMPSPEDKEL